MIESAVDEIERAKCTQLADRQENHEIFSQNCRESQRVQLRAIAQANPQLMLD